MASENSAAWIKAHKAHPFEVGPAPLATPKEGQVLVKNGAIGVNPVQYKMQNSDLHKENFTFPAIYGEDFAGEVVSVGPGVTGYKPGDRVAALSTGFITGHSEENAFQKFVIADTRLVTKIPDNISFEQAAAIPLGVSTAAAGLFNPEFLNLDLPTSPPRQPNGKVLLVWGGASCVGGNAILLAVAAGYEVVSTASPKNFDAVRKLGASHVFDYKSPTVVADLLEAVKGKPSVGALDAVGGEAFAPVQEFVKKAGGVQFIAVPIPGWPTPPEGVTESFMFSLSILKTHTAKAVWEDLLPKALASGYWIPFPEPLVFGTGLEHLQGAVDHLRDQGVSAQKAVVSL